MSNKSNKLFKYTLFSFLILLLINNSTTNIISRQIILVVRFIVLLFILTGVLLLKQNKQITINAIIFFLFFVLYGFLISFFYDNGIYNMNKFITNDFFNLFIISLGVIIFTHIEFRTYFDLLSINLVTYILFSLLITIAIKGFTFSFPPHFIFDYASIDSIYDTDYSQGISLFYGVGAISSFFTFQNFKKKIYLIISFLFIFFALIGGARGETIALLTTLFFYCFYIYGWRFLPSIIIIVLFFYTYIAGFENFIIIQRFLEFGNANYGVRDLLIIDTFSLLKNNINILTAGGGFNFFQIYYNYSMDLYPHNFILEMFVVFGIPLSLIYFSLLIRGVMRYLNLSGRVDLFILLFFFHAIIALKSGSILTNWFFICSSYLFISLNFIKVQYLKNSLKF